MPLVLQTASRSARTSGSIAGLFSTIAIVGFLQSYSNWFQTPVRLEVVPDFRATGGVPHRAGVDIHRVHEALAPFRRQVEESGVSNAELQVFFEEAFIETGIPAMTIRASRSPMLPDRRSRTIDPHRRRECRHPQRTQTPTKVIANLGNSGKR